MAGSALIPSTSLGMSDVQSSTLPSKFISMLWRDEFRGLVLLADRAWGWSVGG